jgi:hypothetical protein
MAELKAHVPDPPTLPDDGYSIAVYGVPSSFAKGDPTSSGKPLKELAFLRRGGNQQERHHRRIQRANRPASSIAALQR